MEDSFYHRDGKGSTSTIAGAAGVFILFVYLLGCSAAPRSRLEEEQRPPFQQIQESIQAGDPENALRQYRDYLEAVPGSPVDRLLLARLLLAASYPQEARSELTLLIEESGPTIEILLTLSFLERLAGDADGEREILENALEIDDHNPAVLAALGALQLQSGEYAQAELSFQGALETDPREATALRGLAVVYLQQEKYLESVQFFDRAIEADPDNPLNYTDRARGRAALKDREGALQDLTAAIDLDPHFYWNYLDRGKHYLQLHRWEAAERDLSRAIEIDPGIFLAYTYRAGLYDRLNRVPEAIADYSRVLELKPEYVFAYAPLAVLRYLEEDWRSAAEAFRQAYNHEPEEPSYALLAALSLMQLGENESAREYLQGQLRDFPGESWAMLIARFFLDPALEARTIDAASKEQNKLSRSRMLFFIASRLLMDGRIDTALRYLLLVKETDRRDLPEKRIAEALLSRFGYED